MKTTKRFLYFAAVSSFLFAACSREAVAPEENVTPGENNGGTYPVYFGAEATLNDAASGDDITVGTKVSLTPDADDSSFEASWDYNDLGRIQYSCNDDNFYLTGAYKDATWNGKSFIVYFDAAYSDKASNWKYTLVYPHINSLLSGKDRVQNGNAYNSEYDLMIGNASVTSAKPGYDDNGKTIIFNMLRETGIAYFHFTSNLDETLVSANLTVDGGTIASEAVSLKSSTNYSEGFNYSGEQYNSINMTFTDAPSALDFKLWFNVLPTTYNSSTLVIETTAHKLTLTKNAGEYSYEKQKLYKVKGTISDAKWVALDEYNVNLEPVTGGTLSASPVKAVRGTEITLTATADDGYEFKNDWNVTDSQGNKVTVTNGKFTMPESDVTVTASFAASSSDINLSSHGIANCYIVPPTADLKYKFQTNNINGSVDNVTGCAVLWESFGTDVTPNVGDLVKNVSYSDGYISFTTTGKAGNALIAAKNADAVILWSWHIWITETPADLVYPKNSGTFMDRNLGATTSTAGASTTLGLYYQWGRKDPFVGRNIVSTVTDNYTISNDSSSQNVAFSIANPNVFIGNSGNWDSDNTTNLWSETVKKVYDPCPYGYKIPNGGDNNYLIASGFSKPSSVDANNGFSFNVDNNITTWYPAAGNIGLTGTMQYVGSYGRYWTVSRYSTTSGYYLRLQPNSSLTRYLNYGYGLSVRCQKE